MRLDDEVKRLESELAKVGVAEKIREREALRALQEREWERGQANADHARVLRDATTRAEDAERECQSLRKRSEDAEARAHAAENQTRDLETRIEHLERSAKDSARASKGSSLTAEINCALREELEELGLELATAREETEARLADCERVRADLKVQNEEVAKLEAALCRAEARAGDAEAAHAASARTVDSLRTELTQMAHKIAELELAAEAGFVERSNPARDAEALERELAEVKTAKETLEGETWTLREELAEATIARLERGAAGGSDASPAAGDDSADAVADVAAGLAVDMAADAAVEAAEAKKGRPAPRTPILADGRSSVSSLSFSVSSSNGASGTFPVTPANDATAAMAAAAARERRPRTPRRSSSKSPRRSSGRRFLCPRGTRGAKTCAATSRWPTERRRRRSTERSSPPRERDGGARGAWPGAGASVQGANQSGRRRVAALVREEAPRRGFLRVAAGAR